MRRISENYRENVEVISRELRVGESFDLLQKTVRLPKSELTMFFIDGFTKDTPIQTMIMQLSTASKTDLDAVEFLYKNVPYVEADVVEDLDEMIISVLSGAALIIGSSFGAKAIIIDTRTYPARETSEPEGDRVMSGARDGFVETLIFNTALIRRRIRNPALTMHGFSVGGDSVTDVIVCYMADRADADYVKQLEKRIGSIRTGALTVGQESLKECLIRDRWYNPFPKIRSTERPDVAAAQLLEGSVLILVDNSPQVMVLPSTIFDFMQESNDFYFPPLTGTYIRLVRYVVFFMTLVITPVWYLMIKYPAFVPEWLAFAMPEESGKLPIFVQLLLVEFIIDALRLASLNTPSMLNNSLSIIGGLILGDFAVSIGWLIPEVILYMAFVAIANFTQRSYELGYAIKFLRIFLLISTEVLGIVGFGVGFAVVILLLATNSTVNGKRNYLYPLVPFRPAALLSLIVRVGKRDVEKK